MQQQQQQILSLIQKMRTDEVNDAQQKLMSLVNNEHFMNTVFKIIKNGQISEWIKTIASTFLNRVICQKLQQFGYKNMFSAINNIMSSYQISSSNKRCFERSLISLIEYIQQPQEIDEWRAFILKHISDKQLFDTGLLLISCTAIAQIQSTYLNIIIQQTFELTLKSFSVTVQNANVINQLLKNWIVVFDKLTSIQKSKEIEELRKKIALNTSLAKILFTVYQLSSPGEIWLCVQPQLYELNMLKSIAAQRIFISKLIIVHTKIAQFSIKNKITQSQSPCLQVITQSYNTIKNTIAVVGSNLNIIQNYQCQDFITNLFSLLVVYVKIIQTHQAEQMNVLIHIVCLPFLKTRDQQLYIFQESPVEFNSLAQDLCDKQTFGILKTEAAKLLQTVSDHCDEAMATGIKFCVECIKIKMGYVPLPESSEIKIIDIQTAFQILAIYSFGLDNYPSELQALKIILCDKRMMDLPPIQLSKVFLLLAYNYGQVFPNLMDGSMWIDYALNYKKHPTTRYMGLDFISNISDEYFTENFFIQFIKLITQCQQNQSGQIWSIVLKIFDSQKQKINEDLCLNLVNTIFLRIQKQIQLLQSKNKQSTIDVINALHILRKIIQQRSYIESKQALKQRIFSIAIIYNKTVQLDIEDQIIKILIEFLKVDGQKVRQDIYHLLPNILAQFKKTQYHQKTYFILINQIIVKSQFHAVKPIIKSLLSGLMFHLFDMSQIAKRQKMKIAIANILTILQNLLSVHGYQMSGGQDDCLCQIGAMCIRLFPSQQDQKIFNKGLLAKALNLMFICHLYSKTQNTVDYLIKYANQNIFHKYDAFVLVKLLSKALFSEQNIQIVIQYLNLMIQIANSEQRQDHKKVGVKNAKGKMKIKRQLQLNLLLDKITSPFIDFECKKFSQTKFPIKKEVIQCVTKMKSTNVDTYKLIIMNMNEEQKSKLASLINQVAEVQGKKRVIRKVIGVKAKQEQQQNQLNKGQNQDADEQQDQSEINNFKRQRVLKKKKESKKTSKQIITQ